VIVDTQITDLTDRRPATGTDERPHRVFAILPFRGLEAPKSRLSDALTIEERRSLALGLVRRTARSLCSGGVERVALVTFEERVADLEIDGCAETILQERPGLNRAIRDGQEWALDGGADALLIVLPDLPLLSPEDVRVLLDCARREHAVLASDRHGEGTNALLLAPPDAIEPHFGHGSAERHYAALDLAGVPVLEVHRPGTSLDLDTPDDLEALSSLGHDWREYLAVCPPLAQPVPLGD
jgi:2-phospho-L-lactate guanylyltransferase